MTGLPAEVTGTVVTVGSFDGVHLGHHDILGRLAERSRETGLRSALVTFEPHPLEIVNPAAAPPLLTTWDEKLEVLATCGVDYVIVLQFTAGLAALTAERFVDEVLIQRVRMRELLIGHDHGFGRDRRGNVAMLRAMAPSHGFTVSVIEPVGEGSGHAFSSTAIRRAVAGGDLARAAEALGRPYSVSGRVERGAGRGREMGFRTINIAPPPPQKLLPPEGVYAARVQTPSGAFGGMLNLGPRPTFNDHAQSIEAHLFDADVELYGALVRLEFIERLRETRRFDSPAALVAQLRLDERHARDALSRHAYATQ